MGRSAWLSFQNLGVNTGGSAHLERRLRPLLFGATRGLDAVELAGRFRRIINSEAIWLAAVPFIGSLVSLAFEAGYLSFYGVPVTFVHLDLPQIAAASVFVAVVVAMLAFLSEIVFATVRGEHPVRQALVSPLFKAFFFFPFVLLGPLPATKWLYFFGFALAFVVLELVPPIFSRRDGSYLVRLAAQVKEDRDADGKQEPLMEHVKGIFGLTAMAGLLVFLIGFDYASDKGRYFVAGTGDKVMVANYGDLFVFTSFDQRTGELGTELTITKLDSGQLKLHERLGKLKRHRNTPHKGDGGN